MSAEPTRSRPTPPGPTGDAPGLNPGAALPGIRARRPPAKRRVERTGQGPIPAIDRTVGIPGRARRAQAGAHPAGAL